MRGNPYLRLRRTVARAFRGAIVGSLAVALLAIAAAVAATMSPGEGEASSPPSALEASLTEASGRATLAGPPPEAPDQTDAARPVVEPLASIAPSLPEAFEELAPPASAATPAVATRRVATSAIGQAAGPPALTEDERREALVARAAERPNAPEVIESPYSVTLSREPGLTHSPPLEPGDILEGTVSFYYCEQGDTADGGDGGGFCGAMRDGTVVYEGAAACAFTYLGQRFTIVGDPTGRIYTCHDTGNAVHGVHRDIFFFAAADGWPWLQSVGTRAILEIVD